MGGAAGSAALTVGTYVNAALPEVPPWLDPVRPWVVTGVGGTRAWSLVVCVVGAGLLTLAWTSLGFVVRRGEVGVAGVRRTVLAWVVPVLLAPPMFSADGWSYAADGFLTAHGLSPYVVAPSVLHGPILAGVCPCWRSTPAPYGPVPLLWGGAFGRFTSDPWALLLSFRLLALVGLALLLGAVPRLARRTGRSPVAATWLAASPLVVVQGVGGVHVDLVVVGLISTALVLARPGRWWGGAVVVGLATAVKAPAVVAALGVALLALPPAAAAARRLRAGALAVAVALGTTAVIGALGGLGVGWVRTLHVSLGLDTPLSLTYDAQGWIGRLVGSDVTAVVDLAGAGLLALACAAVLWRAPAGDAAAGLTTTGVLMLLTTVLSPVTNYWYFLWCLPLLACCRLPPVATRCVVAMTAFLGLAAPLDPTLRLPGIGDVLLTSVAVCLVLAVGGPGLGRVLARGRTTARYAG